MARKRTGESSRPAGGFAKATGGSATRPLRGGGALPTARPTRTLALLLGVAFVIPFLVLFGLLALDVRLGEGYFAYRYSPIRGMRTPRAFVAIAIGLIACGVVWMLTNPSRRRGGFVGFNVTLMLWGVWAWWAPPFPMTQHMFSLTSPSSDGAFIVESYKRVESLPAYLRDFEQVLKTSVDDMGGTRVLSNPPGMTILTEVVANYVPGRAAMERNLIEGGHADAEGVEPVAAALRIAMVLCAIWAASGAVGYALGRLFLSPAGAAVFAVVVMFNPCSVDFVPGKDPAQLLTVNAMLWAWLAARRWNNTYLAAAAGALLVIGSTFSLVHIWVATATLLATLWHDRDGILKHALAAALGAAVVVLLTYLAIGWNIPSTLLAVARRWNEIQKTFAMSRATWYVIGLPIFLLFMSPAVFAMIGLSLRRRRLNFGTKLALCTAGIMLFIYFVLGMTYELPRLWLAFLPPLVLGLCIDRPLLRGSGLSHRPPVARALMLIVLTQSVFTALHWTIFDPREVEYRLTTQRYYH